MNSIDIATESPQIVFPTGSTVLHLVYGSPRPPKDTDLMVPSQNFKSFIQRLQQRFGEVVRLDGEKWIEVDGKRLVHCRKISVADHSFDCITTEPFDENWKEQTREVILNRRQVSIRRLEEIVSIKLIWLLWVSQGRKIFRAKDVYDVWWILENEIVCLREFREALHRNCIDFNVPPAVTGDERLAKNGFRKIFNRHRKEGRIPDCPDFDIAIAKIQSLI